MINEIIDPTPGYIVDEGFNVNRDLNRSDENETRFHLNKSLQKRLDDILKTHLSVRRVYTPDRNAEILLNNVNENISTKTEDIYIEDSPLKDIKFFILPPANTREDFEVNFKENDLIVFKSSTLSIVIIEKKSLLGVLNNILNQTNMNIVQTKVSCHKASITKIIKKIENLINKIPTANKDYIESKINQSGFIKKLIDEELRHDADLIEFGNDYSNYPIIEKSKKRTKKRRSPYNLRKRKYIGFQKELKILPDVFTLIPTDQTKKNCSCNKSF